MQKIFAAGLFLLIALHPAVALTTTAFVNTSGDGLWGTATNWSLGVVPSAGDNAVINNGLTASITANAPAVDFVTAGNNSFSNTTLNISANLTANTFRVAYAANSIGQVNQTAGRVIISNSFTIASVVTGAGEGSYAISGGSLDFSNVTLTIGTQASGTFTIAGKKPVTVGGGDMMVGAAGTLAFDLDMLGVTPLTLSGALTGTSQIVVDGTDYEGLDGYFPLVLATNIASSFTNAIFRGFAGREPALVLQSDGLWLRLIAPPAFSDQLCSLVPASTVATTYTNTEFSITRALQPTVSAWGPPFNEAVVMDTELSQTSTNGGTGATNQSWCLRVGRGGQLYSLRTPALGETVPPSYQSSHNSPWNDEVWQAVAVDGTLNAIAPYFDQCGVYMNDPALTLPFYSPQVAAHSNPDDHSFTSINWYIHPQISIYTDATTSNDWQSYLLVYTRYRDLGQGVVEVSLGEYNYGPDTLDFLNMPWGGVRRTSTEYAFLSQPVSGWSGPVTNSFGPASTNYNLTGGWMGYSASSNGLTPALGFVFGQDSAPLAAIQTRASTFRWGYAGGMGSFNTNEATWRNYFVTSCIRWCNLTQGRGVWSRYYFVLGDNLLDLARRIIARNLVSNAKLIPFNYTEATTPLIGYRFSGSGSSFRITTNDLSPQFYLYAYPVSGSFPIFEVVKSDTSRQLTWNPYAIGVIKPYDGTIAGIRLLGFALATTNVNSGTNSFVYKPLAEILAGPLTNNYIATGQTLSVRASSSFFLTNVQWLNGSGLQISGTGPAGQPWRLFSTTNLALPWAQWTLESSNTFPGSGQFNYTSPAPAGIPQRFYRLTSP